MQILKEINAFPVSILMGGVILFTVVGEGQLYPHKALEPHAPHQIYFSASTSQLSYVISCSTAQGSGVVLSNWL